MGWFSTDYLAGHGVTNRKDIVELLLGRYAYGGSLRMDQLIEQLPDKSYSVLREDLARKFIWKYHKSIGCFDYRGNAFDCDNFTHRWQVEMSGGAYDEGFDNDIAAIALSYYPNRDSSFHMDGIMPVIKDGKLDSIMYQTQTGIFLPSSEEIKLWMNIHG